MPSIASAHNKDLVKLQSAPVLLAWTRVPLGIKFSRFRSLLVAFELCGF